MDNYFISMPLLKKLQACEYGATGTTRPYKDILARFKELKTWFSTKLEWDTFLAKIINNTFCLA
jgi:hypothetical protein